MKPEECERCAALVDVMIDQVPWRDHLWARAALATAARAIRRGRHLTNKEKFDNLMRAVFDEMSADDEGTK